MLVPILSLSLLTAPVADWALCRTTIVGVEVGALGAVIGCLSAGVVEIAATLAIAALWFGHRRWRSFAPAMRLLLRWRVLRAVVAFKLYVGWAALVCGLPLALALAYQAYTLPHFQAVSRRSVGPLGWGQERLLDFASAVDAGSLFFLLMIGATLPLSFACGRLLFVHGLGARLGPDTPRGPRSGHRVQAGEGDAAG